MYRNGYNRLSLIRINSYSRRDVFMRWRLLKEKKRKGGAKKGALILLFVSPVECSFLLTRGNLDRED